MKKNNFSLSWIFKFMLFVALYSMQGLTNVIAQNTVDSLKFEDALVLNATPNLTDTVSFIDTLSVNEDFRDEHKTLFKQYNNFKEFSIKHRRFKHRDIVPLIEALPFEKKVVGKSFEQRNIYQIKLGTGRIKILLWSQMHGDESTATMALFDIFNFFQAKNDSLEDLRQQILKNCTLYFVPMLNPDGAERFQRRTVTEIDMNRDALRLQTPEGVLLKKLQNTLMPDFAFNLHDQGYRYSAGKSNKQATISFLATAYNKQRQWNDVRTKSMQVICSMNAVLQQFLAGHVAKYSDEHEPRAFGDNIQKWGSSLILIESGGYKDDREKQFIRKLNFVAMLSAFKAISDEQYKKYTLKDYETLPTNGSSLYDVLIRNARFIENGRAVVKDIGINLIERNVDNATKYVLDSRVEDLGDLSTMWGIREMDARGMTVHFPKDHTADMSKYKLSSRQMQNRSLRLGNEATFLLVKDKKIEAILINGIFMTQ